MTFRLILSGPNEHGIALSKHTTRELQTYQKNALRFIFNAFATGQPGAILNVDLNMNHEHVCAIAIDSLYEKKMENLPSVLLCDESRFMHWFYFMKKCSQLEVFKLTENNVERLLTRNEAVILIVTEKDHLILRNFVKDYRFFCLLVDQIDVMIAKLITKQVRADFHLGITHRNFIIDPDQTIRWKVTNWAFKKANMEFRTLTDFIRYDNAYLKIHVDPYTSFWHMCTWDLCSSAEKRRHAENQSKLLENITNCGNAHGFQTNGGSKPKSKSSSTQNLAENGTTGFNKRRIAELEESFEHWTSDEDVPPDLSVFEVSTNASTSSASISSDSPKKLRLKSPKGKERPADDFNSAFVEFVPKAVAKGRKLDFDDSLPREEAYADLTLRKTKSDHISYFDELVIDEFSKPFEGHMPPARRVAFQATQSDSALVPRARNVRLPKDAELAINELNDVQVLREFSESFEPSTCSKRLITRVGLGSLMTSEIVNDISGSTCPTCNSYKGPSQEDILQFNLHLSDDDSDAAQGKLGSAESHAVFESKSDSIKCSNDQSGSSDDDIDNYMIQFLETMKQATKLNPKSSGSFKFPQNDHTNMPSACGKEIAACQQVFSDDSDGENFLKNVILDKTCQNFEGNRIIEHANVISYADSPEENFLTSFL